MREFNFEITDILRKGLSPDARLERDSQYLLEAHGFVTTEYGLETFLSPNRPQTGANAFPFPQVFKVDSGIYRFDQAIANTVNPTTWVSTPLTIYNREVADNIIGIAAGGDIWHFAETQGTWFAFNGTSVVFKVPVAVHAGARVYTQQNVHINTGCSFRGRFLTGGFNTANLWNSDWQTIFTAWQIDNPGTVFTDIGKNFVMWSSIGGTDFPLWLFYPVDALAAQDVTAERVIQKMHENMFGWMPMSWDGEVQAMISMRDGVVVYGDNGISFLKHVAGAEGGNVLATFGEEVVANFGIAGRGCAAGGDDGHLFIDHRGVLWNLSPNLQLSRLGYRDFLEDHVADYVMVHDPHRNRTYFNNNINSYVYSVGALNSINEKITGGIYVEGEYQAWFNTGVDVDAVLVSPIFDMGVRGLKTITSIGLGISSNPDLYIQIDYRYQKSDGWQRSRKILVNREGNVHVMIGGLEFRIVLSANDNTYLNLDYAQVRWQANDNRNTRGQRNAGQVDSRTG